MFVAILEEEEDQGTGTGEGRGTLSSEIPVDMMAANARTPRSQGPMQRQIRQRARVPIRRGVRPVEWSLMGMRVVTLGAEQRKTDRDAGSGSGSWGGDAFWSPHSSYAIVPSRPNCPRRRKRGRWAGETWGAGGRAGGSWGTQRGRWNGGASLATSDNLQADPPWLRGSSDCRVGQAPMQAVHGFPGASPFPILQRRRLPPRRQPTSLSGKRHHDGSPPEFSFLSQDVRGPGCPVCINSSLPTPELPISPPGRWPAVEVPNSTLTGPRPTRHHVFVVANLALTSH